MSTEKASSPSPPLPPRSPSTTTAKPGDPNVTMLYGIAGAVAAIALGLAVTSFKVFLGFLGGALVALAGIYGALYYLLNIAEAAVAKDKQEEVDKKSDQPKLDAKVRQQPQTQIPPLPLLNASLVLSHQPIPTN